MERKSSMTRVTMGALSVNRYAVEIAKEPCAGGDIFGYHSKTTKGTPNMMMIDTPITRPETAITWNVVRGLPWSRTGVVFTADRVLINDVSWNELNDQGFVEGRVVELAGRQFLCRMPTITEWNDVLDYAVRRFNDEWNYKDMRFWCADDCPYTSADGELRYVCAGSSANALIEFPAAKSSEIIGFRPILIPLIDDVCDKPKRVVSRTGASAEASTAPAAEEKETKTGATDEDLSGKFFSVDYDVLEKSLDRALALPTDEDAPEVRIKRKMQLLDQLFEARALKKASGAQR